MRDWKKYNQSLVRRGEILLSFDVMETWKDELDMMNRGKEGKTFKYPDSFMQTLGYARAYLHLPYRQTEGLIRTHMKDTMKHTPTYSAIFKRVNKLDIKLDQSVVKSTDDIVIAIDSTGIKVANRGEWMRDKWHKRRGFLKIHVAVDVKSKKITGLDVTDETSHDSKHMVSLLEQSEKYGNVASALMDGAFDSEDGFLQLWNRNIISGIKVRENSACTGDTPRGLYATWQISDYDSWKEGVGYGKRWMVESVFSAIKRIFGEHVMAHSFCNMVQELKLKASLWNKLMDVCP